MRAVAREPQDRGGFGRESDGGQGGSGQRAAGGNEIVAAAPLDASPDRGYNQVMQRETADIFKAAMNLSAPLRQRAG